MNFSRSKLFEMLDTLKCWSLNVEYDSSRQVLHFVHEAELDIQLSLKVINAGESRKTFLAAVTFFPPYFFLDGRDLPWPYNKSVIVGQTNSL